jgi:hypothetical protein
MLPLHHLVPITLATAAMAALLSRLPEATSLLMLAGHIAAGVTVYGIVLIPFYATSLLKMLRLRHQQSES